MLSPPYLFEFKNVAFSYDGKGRTREVLTEFSLKFQGGSILAIIGPNACGKSTLLKLAAGIEKPDSGTVTYANSKRPKVGFSFQDTDASLMNWLNVGQNIVFPMGSEAVEKARDRPTEAVFQALEGLGMQDLPLNRYPYELSGGQKQLCSIARAFAGEPELIMLDEPFGALDYVRRQAAAIAVRNRITRSNASAVLVTHSIEEAILVGDSVLVLGPGGDRVNWVAVDLGDMRSSKTLVSTEFERIRRCLI